MPDREKVKTELDAIVDECRGCDYVRFEVVVEHCTNILDMLKEQEAVEPKSDPFSPAYRLCGKCGMCISRFYDYCPYCGQKVKWDG